jgi:hypothetical protein
MAAYIITYDLNKQKDYPAIYEAIKGISGTWCRPTESTWITITTQTATEIRDHLRKSCDADDSIFVAKLASPPDAAWVGLAQAVSDWLKANL